MARNLQKGISRFDIRLDPPEMGRVDVRMEVRKDGHVVAHMTVDRPETLDLLQRDARALQQALNNAGLQADSDSLNFSLRDQNDNSGGRDFAAGGNANASDDADVEMPLTPISASDAERPTQWISHPHLPPFRRPSTATSPPRRPPR
jgi:hypothetical protein